MEGAIGIRIERLGEKTDMNNKDISRERETERDT